MLRMGRSFAYRRVLVNLRNYTTDDTRTFTQCAFYKDNGAMTIKPIPPTFVPVGANSRKVSRNGSMLFEFSNILGDSGGGERVSRKYDWSRKAQFSLNISECGEILRLNDTLMSPLQFLRGTNVNLQSEASTTSKEFRIIPSSDMSGLTMMLTTSDTMSSGDSFSYAVPITWGELEVVKSIVSFSIPRLLAFDVAFANTANYNGGNNTGDSESYAPIYYE